MQIYFVSDSLITHQISGETQATRDNSVESVRLLDSCRVGMVCQRLALPDSECTGASFLMAEGMSHLVAFVYPNHPQQEQTAEVAETEPMSGEIVASMNEQQEITIKDLQKSMQMGVEQVSKLPEHLGPMLQGMRDLKGALPHPDRIQDEKTRQHFQAAHDELRETRDKLVSKVALLQTQGGTCRGMIISLGTLIQKLYRTCLSPSSQMIKFDPAAFRDEISQVRSFSQQMAEHFAGWGQARTACAATSALTKIEVLIPAANANAMVSSSDEALQKYTKAEADIQYLVAKRYQQQYVLDASRAQLEDIKKNRSAEEEAIADLEKRMEELNKQTALLEEARKGEFDHLRLAVATRVLQPICTC